jgi:ABC-2 type transport system permease protein
MIFGLIKYHLLTLIREPMILFFSVGFPFLTLFLLDYGYTYDVSESLPILLIVAAIVLCFTDSGVSHAYARQIKFLRRLRMTPAKSVHYIFTGIVSRIGVFLLLAAGLIVVMVIFFDMNISGRNWALFVAVLALVFVMLYTMGMFVANLLKGAKNSQSLCYVVFFALLILGGLMFPLDVMPNVVQTIGRHLPPTYAINLLHSAWMDTGIFYGHDFITVVAITVIFALLSIKCFK